MLALISFGDAETWTGQPDQAESHLEQAVALFGEMDMRYWLEQAEAERRKLGDSSKG